MHACKTSLVWFRRDLRDFDHAALHHALCNSERVYCVFIFDTDILDTLRAQGLRQDRRLAFIRAALEELDVALRAMNGALIVRHGRAVDAIPDLAFRLNADAVYANHDYEPQAVARDAQVAERLAADGKRWFSFKDQVIFEKNEVLTQSGRSFPVFTPYKRAWLRRLYGEDQTTLDFDALTPYPIAELCQRFALPPSTMDLPIPSLSAIGFENIEPAVLPLPSGMSGGAALLDAFLLRLPDYDKLRDFPATDATSHLSVHLRFGTVSIRTLARHAIDNIRRGEGAEGAATWLSELIWRDFYFMILHHHPRVAEQAFKPAYDRIAWEDGENATASYKAWCEGRTGYPLVDAAMTQLNQTGFMHNRLRMVTASFLIKDLGIDWRWGERYFARQLNDFDLAANNGGWQWVASSGCDAQPYFRIFNPITQSQKFDPDGKFIRRFLPQLGRLDNKAIHAPWLASERTLEMAGIELGKTYPLPIVTHEIARQKTLARYAVVK